MKGFVFAFLLKTPYMQILIRKGFLFLKGLYLDCDIRCHSKKTLFSLLQFFGDICWKRGILLSCRFLLREIFKKKRLDERGSRPQATPAKFGAELTVNFVTLAIRASLVSASGCIIAAHLGAAVKSRPRNRLRQTETQFQLCCDSIVSCQMSLSSRPTSVL